MFCRRGIITSMAQEQMIKKEEEERQRKVVQTRSQAKSSEVCLPEVHGVGNV